MSLDGKITALTLWFARRLELHAKRLRKAATDLERQAQESKEERS